MPHNQAYPVMSRNNSNNNTPQLRDTTFLDNTGTSTFDFILNSTLSPALMNLLYIVSRITASVENVYKNWFEQDIVPSVIQWKCMELSLPLTRAENSQCVYNLYLSCYIRDFTPWLY